MSRLDEAVTEMMQVPPCDWWRFVPCRLCRALRGESCVKGGAAWPEPSVTAHSDRRRAGLLLHGTLWLICNGYAGDVLAVKTPAPAVVGTTEGAER